jgi:opacity protein-like surface antigen
MWMRALVAAVVLVVAGSSPALAQTFRAELAGWGGWSFSDGVDGDGILAGDGNLYNRIDPKDGGIFGGNIGFLTPANGEVGFMYSYQFSKLLVSGTTEREIGDMSLQTYHGYFGYNFGDSDAPVRPFLFIGFGATHFSSVDFNVAGFVGSTNGETKFSTTWGAGVKFYPGPNVGVRAAVRWTPTYVKSDANGWWCDPYWGCYVTGNPQYANQLDLTGGITIRF